MCYIYDFWFLEISLLEPVSNDIILNAIFGGNYCSAIGVGCFKVGCFTGGLDIIADDFIKIKDKPAVHTFSFLMQLSLSLRYVYGLEKALYTLVLYVSTRIIDAIHTRHAKD
ncbi:hypothetical protein CW304_18205 [Bacillus sp. UFRGS-B20]|nr:hypothetical protein CW304_18205 [Bacillus sp. UFRGS-B20]